MQYEVPKKKKSIQSCH